MERCMLTILELKIKKLKKRLLTLKYAMIWIYFCWLDSGFNNLLSESLLFCIYISTLDITLLDYDNEKHIYIKIILFLKLKNLNKSSVKKNRQS